MSYQTSGMRYAQAYGQAFELETDNGDAPNAAGVILGARAVDAIAARAGLDGWWKRAVDVTVAESAEQAGLYVLRAASRHGYAALGGRRHTTARGWDDAVALVEGLRAAGVNVAEGGSL